MHSGLKLLTGLAATVVLARGAMQFEGHGIQGRIGWAARHALIAHGVTDGSIALRPRHGPGARFSGRIVYIAGTADAATRAAVLAQVKRAPAVEDARWDRP